MNWRRVRKWTVASIAAPAALVALFVGTRLSSANFGTVEPGRIYRSGQMSAGQLDRAIHAERVRTVLNLRGDNPKQRWYQAERSTTVEAGATQVDVHMASDLWLSRARARTLVEILDSSDYPLLIHCEWGSERTGLVSAIATLLRPGSTLTDARRQFSLHFLFVKAGDGAVMIEHLDSYERWLQAQKLAHSPQQFRRWIADGYRPEGPSAEDWKRDPYPPLVVTRPATALGQRDATTIDVRK